MPASIGRPIRMDGDALRWVLSSQRLVKRVRIFELRGILQVGNVEAALDQRGLLVDVCWPVSAGMPSAVCTTFSSAGSARTS